MLGLDDLKISVMLTSIPLSHPSLPPFTHYSHSFTPLLHLPSLKMPQLKHILASFAMLALASAQSTSLPTAINADSASTVQTSYTLTGTSIAAATGPPPSVSSTTIHVASTAVTPIPTASSTATSTPTPSTQLSIPAIAGIAAGAALLLIATTLFLVFSYLRRRQTHSTSTAWPSDTEKFYDPSKLYSTSHPLPRRPSSATTLVNVPTQTYAHSKGSFEYVPVPAQAYTHSKSSLDKARPAPPSLHHSKSARPKSIHSHATNLSRVSEEPGSAHPSFKFDFTAPLSIALTPAPAQANSDALQKLIADKSLPSSPEHEIPMTVLDLGNYQTQEGESDGRPRSSVYSTVTGRVLRDRETSGESQGYF
jgi:hypothetical protein